MNRLNIIHRSVPETITKKTSRLYTDLSLMTYNVDIGLEAANVFQALAMGETIKHVDHLLVAPKCLQNKILDMMDEEIAHARAGEPAYIGLKMNSLTDKKIMEKLVEAPVPVYESIW